MGSARKRDIFEEFRELPRQSVPGLGEGFKHYGQSDALLVVSKCLCQLRLVLCALLAMSKNAVWVVEQPARSLLCRHPRFEWLLNCVAWAPCSEAIQTCDISGL